MLPQARVIEATTTCLVDPINANGGANQRHNHDKEQAVYAALRWYNVEPGMAEEMARRVRDGFVPLISSAPGYKGYYLIKSSNAVVITVGIFEHKAAAEQSHRLAADWVARNLGGVILGPPTLSAGEVLVEHIPDQHMHDTTG